ncbi:hypothetical protein LTR04_002116, partial [Oleoguttula sp. CCFEE 6159]
TPDANQAVPIALGDSGLLEGVQEAAEATTTEDVIQSIVSKLRQNAAIAQPLAAVPQALNLPETSGVSTVETAPTQVTEGDQLGADLISIGELRHGSSPIKGSEEHETVPPTSPPLPEQGSEANEIPSHGFTPINAPTATRMQPYPPPGNAVRTKESPAKKQKLTDETAKESKPVEEENEEAEKGQTGQKRRRTRKSTAGGDKYLLKTIRKCDCKPGALAVKHRIQECADADAGAVEVIKEIADYLSRPHEQDPICLPHLMMIAHKAGYVVTGLGAEELHHRLNAVYRARYNLNKLKCGGSAVSNFRPERRALVPMDLIRISRFEQYEVPEYEYEFDAAKILAELCPTLGDTWNEDGVARINVFSWWEELDIAASMREELEFYLHHLRDPPEYQNHGWVRNCFHSLLQQAIRVDPVLYILQCCLRPDRATTLISYPYYARVTLPKHQRHSLAVDVNLDKLFQVGQGGNMVSAQVSLTDESRKNCTFVIPGAEAKLGQWWAQARSNLPESLPSTNFTPINSIVLSDVDLNNYGWEFVKMPLKTGEVLFRKAFLPYGEAGEEGDVRAIVHPYFVRVLSDGDTLELPQLGTASSIAAAHRDLVPAVTPKGAEPVVAGTLRYPFPAAMPLVISSWVGKAILGQIRWTHPLVLRERDELLGENPQIRKKKIQAARFEIFQSLQRQWEYVKNLEYEAYGPASLLRTHYRILKQMPPIWPSYLVPRMPTMTASLEHEDRLPIKTGDTLDFINPPSAHYRLETRPVVQTSSEKEGPKGQIIPWNHDFDLDEYGSQEEEEWRKLEEQDNRGAARLGADSDDDDTEASEDELGDEAHGDGASEQPAIEGTRDRPAQLMSAEEVSADFDQTLN